MNNLQSKIFSQGKEIPTNIISLDIIKMVNKIPYAQVVLCEGGSTDKTAVDLSNEDCFKPGEELEITLSHKEEESTFKGIVIKHNIRKTNANTYLTIDIKDSSLKLSLLRQSAVFNNKEDKQIITDIANLKSIDVECNEATYTHKQIVQYYCTDWDFIVSRAEANGLVVCAENGILQIKKPGAVNASNEITEIYEYEIEADMSSQYKEVESTCWDIKNVEPVVFKNTENISLENSHNYNNLSQLMQTEKLQLVSGIYSEKEEMEAWSNAGMMKNRYSMLRGRISIEGNPKIKLADTIKIAELGEMFDCTTIVSGIRHRIDRDGWATDIQCGLSQNWFYKNDDIVEKPAAGLLPGINGLHVGIVEAFPSDGDPDKFHRIKVRIPAVHEQESVIWARLMFPYAGNGRGMFLVPEEGDEVVVGFFNDDPRHAVIIGSLYNGKTETPLEFTDVNNEKGFVTRNGIKMIFTDEQDKEKLQISTPAGNKMFLEDENGIMIEDKNQNKTTMHDKGVTFEDKNQNKIITDDKGTIVEDTNKNKITLNNKGIEIKDLNGNMITLGSAGIEIKDASGNKVSLSASGATVESAATVSLKGSAISMN